MVEIKAALAQNARDVDVTLEQLLPARHDPESRLMDAVRYATLSGGKRIRPFLVMSSAALFGVSKPFALRVAAAIEMVHCYSLIHDDLPAMDNDDLRRGLPTCHVKFDEATAILAGDALLARAFEVIAEPATHPDPRVRSDLVGELAKAAGAEGMVGGQMLDLLAEQMPLEIAEITRLQRMKTGALIAFPAKPARCSAKPATAHAMPCVPMRTISASHSRSSTIFLMSRATTRRSASARAKIKVLARRRSSRCWGWNARARNPTCWHNRRCSIWRCSRIVRRRFVRSLRSSSTVATEARFQLARSEPRDQRGDQT